MRLSDVLDKYNFPKAAKDIILSSKIENLYPPQAEAVTKGLLDGKNFLMAVPTAAGKTLLAELCMLKSILFNQGRCLYIAPLKALASEKFNDFKKKYESLGVKVGLAIGDLDSPSRQLNQFNIIVATAEKVDSLLRSRADWLINGLQVVILDEIHFINDGLRGPTMEILTARIRQLNPNVQIVGLSATISNARDLAAWLKAELVSSTWRPIPLKEGVYFNEKIIFDGYGTKLIREEANDDLSKMTLDTLRGKGQVLIFVNSRRSAQAVSKQVSMAVASVLTPDETKELKDISKKILGSSGESTKLCQKLADAVTTGAAFHHAGLKPHQRELVEENFKRNIIKVISCTPTLAAGVNLPARRAIIRDCKRFESGLGQAFIPTSEYKQCAGRAGRPQYDDYGEAVLMAKSSSEMDTLFERYIHAAPEPVVSKLGSESALRMHVLSSIAGGYVHDVKSMFEFIEHTFLYHQNISENIIDLITEIFDFLHREKFVEKSGYRFFATPLGALTSRLYIDPQTAIVIRNGIIATTKGAPLIPLGFLHMLTLTPDCPTLNVGKNDVEDLEKFANHYHDEFIFTPENYPDLDELYKYLGTIKTAWLYNQWIEEEREDMICEQFGVGPGDVYRYVESAQWLVYASGLIAEMLMQKRATFFLEDLRNRIRYGIKEELLELASLKGVGRVRARSLFNAGLKTWNDLKSKSADQICGVEHIGKSLARDILEQIQSPPKKGALSKSAR